jgi:hypothetical protein
MADKKETPPNFCSTFQVGPIDWEALAADNPYPPVTPDLLLQELPDEGQNRMIYAGDSNMAAPAGPPTNLREWLHSMVWSEVSWGHFAVGCNLTAWALPVSIESDPDLFTLRVLCFYVQVWW